MSLRRVWAAGWAAIALVLALPASAQAHALLANSEPLDGARLTEAPTEVVLRFTEAPELSLSSVGLLDGTGAELDASEPQPVPGDPSSLRVSVPDLEQGVYTVTWRTVSRVDGHPSGGTFAFGIGVSPLQVAPAEAPSVETPDPSPMEMAGRLILFAGLGLLLGAAWVGALAFADAPGGVRRIAWWAWLASLVGLVVLAMAQRNSSGVGFGDFLPTTVGRALLYRGGAIVLAGTGLLAASMWPRSRRAALLLAGAAAAGAMLAHVAAGHAAARGDMAWAKVMAQWVHFAAVGLWLGGLAALLIGVRGSPDGSKASAVRRFSAVAAVALAAVAITGLTRAINEVGSWGALFSTGYGRLVVAKVGLIVALAGLGAVNRYRNVPKAASSLRGLRKVSRGELALAAGALGVASVLATLVPPAQVPAAAEAPAALAVTGSDFATSVRARLEVNPGLPGANQFAIEVRDYDSGEPVEAQRVAMRFSFLGGAQVEESILELRPTEAGRYQATASNLSIGGPWAVTVLVQQGADAVEVPLEFATLCTAIEIPGDPPLPPTSIVEVLDVGSVEGYLLPLGGNQYEVHFTFLDAQGKELAVEGSPSIVAWRPGTDPSTLEPDTLTQGHFLALARLEPGGWRFDGAARGGETALAGCFEQTLP